MSPQLSSPLSNTFHQLSNVSPPNWAQASIQPGPSTWHSFQLVLHSYSFTRLEPSFNLGHSFDTSLNSPSFIQHISEAVPHLLQHAQQLTLFFINQAQTSCLSLFYLMCVFNITWLSPTSSTFRLLVQYTRDHSSLTTGLLWAHIPTWCFNSASLTMSFQMSCLLLRCLINCHSLLFIHRIKLSFNSAHSIDMPLQLSLPFINTSPHHLAHPAL